MKKLLAFILSLSILFILITIEARAEGTDILQTPSGISSSGLEQFVDDYAAANSIGNKTAGASVAILYKNEIILNQQYGYADIDNNILVNADTVFEWGSASKLLVWTSVMQLVEQGKLSLDEDIKQYLPDNFLRICSMIPR